MAIERSIQNVQATSSTVDLPLMDTSGFVLVTTTKEVIRGVTITRAEYIDTNADPEKPHLIRVEVRRNPSARAGVGQTDWSIRSTNWETTVDSDSGEVIAEDEVTFTQALSFAGITDAPDDVDANLSDFIHNNSSLWYSGITVQEPNVSDVFKKFRHGLANLLG